MIVRNVHRVGSQIVTNGGQYCRDCKGTYFPPLDKENWPGYRVGSYLEVLDDNRIKQWRDPPPARRRCNADPD